MSITKLTLNGKQWKSFCKTLEGLGKQCNDADINDGVIRQRSNDAAAIFEVDMTSMLGSSTFSISNIKEKVDLLKDLSGEVTIEPGQNKVVFSDGDSSYSMPVAGQTYLDNKFMSKQEVDSTLPSGSQEATPLLKHKIEKKDLKRIRNAASTFHTNSHKVVFEDNSASIIVEQGYKGSKGLKPSMEVSKNIPLSQPTTGNMRLSNSPYQSFDYDGDVSWELCRGDKSFLSKHHGSIGDATTLTYTRGELKNDEPEPAPQAEEIPEGGVETPATES